MSEIWVVLVIIFIVSSLIRAAKPKQKAPQNGASASRPAVPAGRKLDSAGVPNLSAAGDAVKVTPAKKRAAEAMMPPRETYVPVSEEGYAARETYVPASEEVYAASDGSLGEGESLWQDVTPETAEREHGGSQEVPGLSLNLNGDDLVRAVIYSEILRRRPGLEVRKAR